MANVYAQASCTISATGSAESSGGCFKKRNPLPYFPCHILADPSSRQSLTVKAANTAFKTNMFHTEVDGGPLNTRAWAFQERLLSQRIIHFGASLIFFECSTLFASELQPEGIYDGVDVLTRDGTKHEFPDLDRWAEMLDPFLPPPQPSAPPALEPEDFTPPEDSAPSKPSVSIKLPNTYGVFPSKHERQARARYNKAWNLYRARKRHRLEENAARGRRHAARERARQESAEQAHLRKSEQALQIPRAPNPAYKAPEVVASLSDNSVTGYRGAFDFLAAAAAAGSSRDIAPRDQLRLHQRWFELVSKYTRSQLTVAGYRHMAAAGVARAIQGPGTNADYLAGLWRRHLEFDLLWSLEGSPKCRPSPYRAPSWSWISVDGAVSQRLLPFTLANEARRCEVDMLAKVVAVQVLDAKTGEEATDATAPIGTGLLELRGVLCPVSQLDVNEATGQGRLLLSGTWAECVMDTLSSEVRGYDDLFCLPVLNMTRFPLLEEESMAKMERASLHGIILRQFGGTSAVKHISSSCKAFERVGSFVLSSLLDDGLGVLEAIRHPTLAGDLASTSISVR
ncbi:hypothetical protein VD0002_g1365 [Verticillium dahliae]|uniref:HET domain-containing protein pin-c2 n=2 Tax=Verticillium dahliae TaxID=27337 RepID=G2X1M0_VERDV|nr:HET domain-containing protein pin-c2 [Verticillium dahliae VdLs.17]KAF3343701.1 Putative exopolygalacturonase B [Verticillium dahliae VDG2]PNH33554.1 hypothetical protein BJF96_g3271 [Verticillium dahliae]EGY22193.1 HET domain-containing protein pin-c2 [Verticillium dahliae VdLs.17]PNH53600.1 hypothetical protein VD0003_g3849 [Verticillium dahliae]PNH68797.1 hypothetical protein VD0002_g1365 [Verticillium dahliae]